MPHRLLVLTPFSLSGDAPAAGPLTGSPDGCRITWRHVPVKMSANGGHADAVVEDLALMATVQETDRNLFDAVVVDSPGDGGASGLRSVLDLLVMGTGKTAALHALTLGTRFSFLVHSTAAAIRLRSELRQWRIESHCASVRVAAADAATLRSTAQRCVEEDAAEVICLGSSAYWKHAGELAKSLDVPVIDPLPLTCEITAALLDAGLTHSRDAAPAPRVRKLPALHAMAAAMTGPSQA